MEQKALLIPDNTKMEEHSIIVEGDAVLGNDVELGYGIIASSITAGERVKISGDLISETDIRLDMWSQVKGNVQAKKDAYLGRFVNIEGKLRVKGDLDVGNNVRINGGFEAKGYILVRNPLPIIMFLLLYLIALLRLGRQEEVEKALEELFEEAPRNNLLFLPNKSKIDLEVVSVLAPIIIGDGCRLTGNIKARSIKMGRENILFGGIRTSKEVDVGNLNVIYGDIRSKGSVFIGRNGHILGKIYAGHIDIHESSRVDGAMHALNGVNIIRDDLEGLNDTEKKLFYGFTLLF